MTPLRFTRRHALEVGIGVAGLAASGPARPAGAADTASRMASRVPGTIPFIISKSVPPSRGGGAGRWSRTGAAAILGRG
jgi:hypothetical protein